MFTAGILTISDKGSRGEREDTSSREISSLLAALPASVSHYEVIPDEHDIIRSKLIEYADTFKLDLIITTGGTGVSPRDVTPDATMAIIEREVPGMAEAMRRESMKITPHAMLSRAVVGIRTESLIINLPGSPKGAKENLTAILPALSHCIEKIKGDQKDCASPI